MENDSVCELCGTPAAYHPDIVLCEACEKELNKKPERLPDVQEQTWSRPDTQLPQISYPNLITKRIRAFLIDGLLVATMSLLLGGGFWWLIAIGYLLVRDALIGGRSIGKFVVGLAVMDHHGSACTLTKSIVRNFFLLLPGVVVEFFAMAFSKSGWRLGDRLAKTQVIDFPPPRIRGAWLLLLALFVIVLGRTQEWHWPWWPDFLNGKEFSIQTILHHGGTNDAGSITVPDRESRAGSERYIIHFRDRQTIAVEDYWERGDEIKYQRLGGIVGVQRNKVAVIEKKVDGTLKQYNPFFRKQ
ncbi:MAG: RDD family protein [Candidatus Methylomirabilales bacterium]